MSVLHTSAHLQLLALAVLAGTLIGSDYAAAESTTPVDATTSNWRVRARVIGVLPDEDSSRIHLETRGADLPLSARVTTDNNVVPEFDLTYMITPHFGVEAIAGITQHDISIDGADPVLTSLGVTDNLKIFDVWVLPPTLTLQYHFTPARKIRPYAGIGVNYTAMLWNDSTKRLESAVGSVEIDTRSSWGWAAQVGVDWDLGNNWFANLDLKYIDMETTASLYVRSLAATLRVNTDVNPWVVGVGLGYRF